MKDIISILQRLDELVIRLAPTKWDVDDCRRERRLPDEEWRRTGLSKNILDGMVIRLIRLQLAGNLDSKRAKDVLTDCLADFRAVTVGCGMPVSGRFHARLAALDDPLLEAGFFDALSQRLDRFESYASTPFPGQTLKV